MKNVLLGLLLAYSNVSVAQTLTIKGTSFPLSLNEAEKTAAIRDAKYKVDDREFPMAIYKRKIKDMGNERVRTLVIPSTYTDGQGNEYSITTIGRAAFAGYTNVDCVVIPSTVTSIEDYAFFRSSVTTVEIPSSVSQIGNRVFGYCPRLKNLTLPLGVDVSPDLYTESREVAVKYQLDETLAQSVAKRKAARGEGGYAQSSDVDEDIPVLKQGNTETFAVIWANENYQKVAKVPCALNDGRAFRRYCVNVLGIPDENVHYVEDATLGNMTEECKWLTKVANVYEGEANIIVYYAGHGIPNESDGAAYLLPVDVAGNNVDGAYSLNSLYATLGALNAKSVTLFMDACFSGSQRGDGMLMAARGVAIKSKAEHPQGKMVVFSAAQGDETAYPYAEKGHGLFTYFLLKKLKETKGDVDYGTLGDYIQKEVSRRSVVVNNKPQTPTVSFSPQVGMKWRSMTLK